MTTEGFKRKLTAILCADVVGYSRLMGENEADEECNQDLDTSNPVLNDQQKIIRFLSTEDSII